MSTLSNRVLEISKKHGLSHVGSCCTAVDIIDKIYHVRKLHEPFILSCGHAGLALYVVLEKYLGLDAEKLALDHGTHPYRDLDAGIYLSTGSLGWGLPIALGMAMADPSRKVFCLMSDGEAAEGALWEVANVIRRYHVKNLEVHLNYNGWAAYHQVDNDFISRVIGVLPSIQVHRTHVEDYGLKGQAAHYCKI